MFAARVRRAARRRPFFWGIAALFLVSPGRATAQTDAPEGGVFPSAAAANSPMLRAAQEEARRYLLDTKVILTSPLRWNAEQWTRTAAVVAALAVLGRKDSEIDAAVQRNRSSRTDAVASAVTPLGSYAGVGISFAALGGGWLLQDRRLRDTGRDAIEAELLAAGIVTPVLKTVAGRLRPNQGSDADEFRSFSRNQSFPSGHSTEAFAVASVFAARSEGWVVPTLSYALATMVGLARVHDRAHFASDVFAGAVIGTAIGRSVVHRRVGGADRVSWGLVPLETNRGTGLAIRFVTAAPKAPGDSPSRLGS